MSAYLFVHFRETTSPEGEQVYFGVSRDGFKWDALNGGKPILWAYYGDMGVRDHTITYCKYTGKYVILATDLSLSYGMRGKYRHSWKEVGEHGSKNLAVWTSDNLTDWSEQRLVRVADEDFGCVWAPDVIFDSATGDYIVHWSSSHKSDGYAKKRIYCARTRDFESFSKPEVMYQKPDGGTVIDSAVYEENGAYYMFLKSEGDPPGIMLVRGETVMGPYKPVEGFMESMNLDRPNMYEAPTAVKLDDGRWCLFIDYYGVRGAGQGYVPFVSDSLESGAFVRSDKSFSFPYGFKHGTIIKISDSDYERLISNNWEEPDRR